ncbi:MAG: hypothetical protein RI894_548, partial [Bacteroidota bacterium]
MNQVKPFFLLFFFALPVFCAAQKPCTFRVAGFDETKRLADGMAQIRKGKLWGFADSLGNVAVVPQYDVVEPYNEGLALVGFFNKQYGDTLRYYDSQLDQDVTEIRFPTTYQFINKKGKIVMRLTDYDEVHPFSDSLCAVGKYIKEAGKKIMTYGFIRHDGIFVVPLQYNAVGDVREGLFSFRKDDRSGFINLKGDTIVPPIYDVVKPFSCGFALVLCHNGRYNYLNKYGKKLLENDVWEASEFRENRAFVRLDNRSQWFSLIDTKGDQVKSLPYKYHADFAEGFCGV